MINALRVFQALMDQTEVSKGLYNYIDSQRVPIDASDLLRWEWVLAVSALDKYIHDVVRIGMVEEFIGARTKTNKFNSFRIDMIKYANINATSSPEVEFENEVVRQHSFLAFQHPDKIADALSFIWVEQNKWDKISGKMATPISANDLKTKLNNIIIRRDQIVHEGDCFTTALPLQQQQINEADVNDVITFIKELSQAIYDCIA